LKKSGLSKGLMALGAEKEASPLVVAAEKERESRVMS